MEAAPHPPEHAHASKSSRVKPSRFPFIVI
jgi:hypothetical protein